VLPSWTSNADGQGNRKKKRSARHHDNRSQSYGDVLIDDPARAKAQRQGEQKILEAVVHEDHFGLLEGRIRAAGTHGHADIGRRQAWRSVHAVPNLAT
jgi:hypothetical protein